MKTFLTALLCWSAWQGTQVSASELRVTVKERSGQPVADAVVLAVPTDPKFALRAQTLSAAVDQLDKKFVPSVTAVYIGSTIRFPNRDNVRHQVYSFSPAKKFELPLYAGTAAQPVVFDKPGVVVLGCNIHDWMIGYVYVSETPFFAKTDSTGTSTIADLPAGEYSVRIWQPSMEGNEQATVRRIAVGSEAASAEWTVKLKPSIPISRVSGGSSAVYP